MGYIYIMTNPALRDMVKIGYATDVELRRQQLSTTALPYEYEIYATYETPGNLEDKKLHKMIDNLNPDLRVSKNREFFIMSPEDAFELLEAIIVKNKIPKNVCLVNDSENDLWTTDMNGIQYCEKRNEICFMEGENIHKPEHAENEEWKLLWPICDE